MNKPKRSTSKKLKGKTNMSLSFLVEHTPESIRGKLYDLCLKNPGVTIESLLRDIAKVAGAKDGASMPEVFRILGETDQKMNLPGNVTFGVLLAALLGMCAGNMAGTVSANENVAKGLAATILAKLTESGAKMTKDQMCAIVFTGVTAVSGLDNRPQDAADFKEALSILVGNANVKRWTSKDTAAEKRWETMQVPKPAKPEKSKQ